MLVVTNLRKGFDVDDGRRLHALDGVSFSIPKGSFFTLLGPSGCGKTTTLRSIAGLERPDEGAIEIGGSRVFESARNIFVSPDKRKIGMVFQSYAIWPHMNVFENVAFPLRVRGKGISAANMRERVGRALETVRLGGFDNRPATRLSGGQQQRLALARALVMEPDLLLLDEPLSNLDAKLREAMRLELRRLQREVGITTVYVTHDQSEALALSDEIAVMHNGRIVQLSDPETIYNRPASRFVASFIGSTNILEGTVRSTPDNSSTGVVETSCGVLLCQFPDGAPPDRKVAVSIRPENVILTAMDDTPPEPPINLVDGKVLERVFLGEVIDYLVNVGQAELRVRGNAERSFPVEAPVRVGVCASHCLALAE